MNKYDKIMNYLDVVKLTKLMSLSRGKSEVKIGLIDGPVATSHPDLEGENIFEVPGKLRTCASVGSAACMHGTFVAGILSGKRNSQSPSICPGCTLLVCPIFTEEIQDLIPSATPKELAGAILECIHAGARLINLSLALVQSFKDQSELKEALDFASKRDVLIVAAAGNQGTIGSSIITRHPWVISVAACDLDGRPMDQSNLGKSISRWGLMAPGKNINSLMPEGGHSTLSGTSVAAPFVSGTIGLLWSIFPQVPADLMRSVVTQSYRRRKSVVPPILDASAAYRHLQII